MATAKNIPDLKQRIVSAAPVEDDSSFELKLRPQRLAEFIGQPKVKENLAVAIEAAKSRGEALDHVLLYGPPGLGKTTLATIIANELAVPFQQTSGPTLQIKGDLTAILTNLRDKQVLFIDEVHRLQTTFESLNLLASEVREMPEPTQINAQAGDTLLLVGTMKGAFLFRSDSAPRRMGSSRAVLSRTQRLCDGF